MNQLDYSALSQPVTSADIAAYRLWRNETTLYAQLFRSLSVLAYISLSVLLLLSVFMMMRGMAPPVSMLFTAIITVIMVLAWRTANRKITIKRAKIYKFAHANDIEFLLEQSVLSDQYSGLIFDEGDSHQINEALRLPNGIEIGNYQYGTGSGKNRSIHIWGYVKIGLTRHLPQMVLDAKSNNILSLTNLPDSFRGQEIVLEGDFNKYFTLYAPKEYDVDARYVFTPDVMAALIDYGSKYDMEVVDNQLYIYAKAPFAFDDTATIQQLMQVIGVIGTELIDQSRNYSDDRVDDKRANVVAEPGRKLKQRFGVTSIAGVFIFFATLAFFIMNNT